MLAIFCSALFTSPASHAQGATDDRTSKSSTAVSPHDLAGIWNGTLGTIRATNTNKDAAPMLPSAQRRFDSNTAELKLGRAITKDPSFSCEPPGVPRIYQTGAHPFEIVQTPGRIFLFYEFARTWRTVWMDGREMPKDFQDPLWMVYSTGRWDGDDLVVDSAGFNDRTWLDSAGHPHSDALHVVERFRPIDHDTLQLEVTVNDEKSYAQPWTMKGTYKLKPDWEIGEAFCVPRDALQFDKHVLQPNTKP